MCFYIVDMIGFQPFGRVWSSDQLLEIERKPQLFNFIESQHVSTCSGLHQVTTTCFYKVSTIYKMFQKTLFVFSLDYILSNYIYILSNHIYILSNRFFILSNRVNIWLKSLSNVFNTKQYFFSNLCFVTKVSIVQWLQF